MELSESDEREPNDNKPPKSKALHSLCTKEHKIPTTNQSNSNLNHRAISCPCLWVMLGNLVQGKALDPPTRHLRMYYEFMFGTEGNHPTVKYLR